MNPPLERTVRVRCPIERAFEVFTAELDRWWPPGHRRFERSQLHLEAWVGGRFFELAAAGEEAELGAVLRCDPPHRITYSWYPGAIDRPTEVDVRFHAEGDHTLVEVTHAEGPSALGAAWPQRVEIFTQNWDQVLVAFAQQANERRQEGADPGLDTLRKGM